MFLARVAIITLIAILLLLSSLFRVYFYGNGGLYIPLPITSLLVVLFIPLIKPYELRRAWDEKLKDDRWHIENE